MAKDKEGILGYHVGREEDLVIPWVIHHESKRKEVLAREMIFSAPLAFAGATIAGGPGAAAGHATGALFGLKREKNIEEASK